MIKIDVNRNEKCLCGSGLKYKKCCSNKSVTFSYITDLDFILVNEYDKSITDNKKSTAYWINIDAIHDLQKVCEEYKTRFLGSLNINKYNDIAFKYVFKEFVDETGNKQLYICNLIELSNEKQIKVENINENILGANYLISKLEKALIPDEILNPEKEIKCSVDGDIETYMI